MDKDTQFYQRSIEASTLKEALERDDPLTIAKDFQQLVFFDSQNGLKHGEKAKNHEVRTGILEYINTSNWEALFNFCSKNVLTNKELSLIDQKLQLHRYDESIITDYIQLIRLIITNDSDQYQFLVKLRSYVHEKCEDLLRVIEDGPAAVTKYLTELKTSSEFPKKATNFHALKNNIVATIQRHFESFHTTNLHPEENISNFTLRSRTTSFLVSQYDGDIATIKDILTADLTRKITLSSNRDQINALSQINSNALLDLAVSHNFDEETQNYMLDMCAVHDPESVLTAINSGIVPRDVLVSRSELIAQHQTVFSLIHAHEITTTSSEHESLIIECFKTGKLEDIGITLEKLQLNPDFTAASLAIIKNIIKARITSEYSQKDTLEKRYFHIKKLEGYPFIGDEFILGTFHQEIIDEITVGLYEYVETEIPEYDNDLDFAISSKKDSFVSKVFSQKYNLGPYDFLKKLPKRDQKFFLGLTFIQHKAQTPLFYWAKDIIPMWDGATFALPNFKRAFLLDHILDKTSHQNDSANDYLWLLLHTTDNFTEAQHNKLLDWADSLLKILDLQVTYTEIYESHLSTLIRISKAITDEQLHNKILRLLAQKPKFLASMLDIIDRQEFLANLNLEGYVYLLQHTTDDYSIYALLQHIAEIYPRDLQPIFDTFQSKSNLLQLFANAEEFKIYDDYSNDNVLSKNTFYILNLYRIADHRTFVTVANEFKKRNMILPNIDVAQLATFERVAKHSNKHVRDLFFMHSDIFIKNDFDEKDVEHINTVIDLYLKANPTAKTADIRAHACMKWQVSTTTMTITEIKSLLKTLSEYKMSLQTLLNLGIWGNSFQILYTYREPFFHALAEQQIVGTIGIENILDLDNIEQSIQSVIQHASSLSTTDPEWERLTQIAINHVITTESQQKLEPSIFLYNSFVDASPENISILKQNICQNLEHVFSTTHLDKLAITARNITFVQNLDNNHLTSLPQNAFIHSTKPQSVAPIIAFGNLAGECLGKISTETDKYPGYVDLHIIDETLDNIPINMLFKKNPFFTISTEKPMLVYAPHANLKTVSDISSISSYKNHHLVAGGIPPTELSFIICSKATDGLLADAKQACITSGIYVPLFDNETGELLFTPEEYFAGLKNFKRFTTLEDMIKSPEAYALELYAIPNTNPRYTIAEHMEQVTKNAQHFAEQTMLTDEIKTIVVAAAKLHDVGKLETQAQEIANVELASKILDQVIDLTFEQKRKILLLIKHDELLGEILKNATIDENGTLQVNYYAQKKLVQLERVFADQEMKTALLVLYQADVAGIGGDEYERWQIQEKLEKLGFPVYELNLQSTTKSSSKPIT